MAVAVAALVGVWRRWAGARRRAGATASAGGVAEPAARAEPAPVHSLPADLLCRTLTAYESENVLEHVARVAQVHPDWWNAVRGSAAYGLGMWRRTDVLRQISRSLKLKGPHQWSQPGTMHRLRLVLPVLPGDEAGRAFGAVLRAMPPPFRFIHLEMRGPVRSTDVYPELTPSGLAPIADAMRHGFAHGILRKLDVTNNRGMGDEGVAMLAKALPPTLEVLSMARTGCGDAGMVAIAATLPSTHIEALDLGWNPDVRETGWLALAAAMPHTPALKVLWLSDSRGMNDAGVQALAGSLPRTLALEELNLGACSFGDEGGRALAMVLPLCFCLTRLEVRRNPRRKRRGVQEPGPGEAYRTHSVQRPFSREVEALLEAAAAQCPHLEPLNLQYECEHSHIHSHSRGSCTTRLFHLHGVLRSVC